MRAQASLIVGIAALALAGGSVAQVPAQESTPLSAVTVTAKPRNDLSEVVVNGRLRCALPTEPGEKPPRPQVVDSYPKPGAVIPPGVTWLRVTYGERMSPCGFILGSALLGAFPDFLDEPALLTRDLKTFYFAVRTEPGKSYAIWFNQRFSPPNFTSLLGAGAAAYEMQFKTSTEPPATALSQSLAADPVSADLHGDTSRLLKLWVPRGADSDDEEDEGDANIPTCGRCIGKVLAGPPAPSERPPEP